MEVLVDAGPAFVLVEPALPENLGAAARALANFGLRDLRVVSPECALDDRRAVAVAAHGGPVLAGTRRFDTLAAALADRRTVWATSARPKELALPTVHPRALGAALREASARGAAPAVVFGPERTGLRYEHLAHADALVHIPTDPACPALNLAQAVAIVAWEWASAEAIPLAPGPVPAPRAVFDAWFDGVVHAVDRAGYLTERALRERALRNVRVALQRAGFTESELRTLGGIARAIARR